MKTTIAFLLALTSLATSALANGTPQAPPPSSSYAPSQHVTTSPDASSRSSSDADASARARAASVSGSSSQGGSASAAGGAATSSSTTGPATSGASLTDQSSTRAYGLSITPSVPSALPSPRDCIGTTNWSAAAPLFLGSGGSSNQGVIPECMTDLQVDKLRRACQFDSANKLQARLVSQLSGFTIEPAADVNLTDEQCRARTAPPPAPPPSAFEAPAAASATLPPPVLMCEAEPTLAELKTAPRAASAAKRAKGRHGCDKKSLEAAR